MKFFSHKRKITTSLYKKAGFTLVEMMVAVFVFSVVMVLSTGAIFNIISANKTSQAIKSVMDNLNSAIDSMSREIRYGTIYTCGENPDFATPVSCADSLNNTTFAFIARPTAANQAGDHIIYYFQKDDGMDTGSIYKCINSIPSSGNCIPLTAPEVRIQNLHFYVQGAGRSESQQPLLLVTISGYARAGSSNSYFNIETMVNQRTMDMCKSSSIIPTDLRPSNCPNL
jgi:prepilin-type N-terminal cleavage/methylation domain-containing protein